jgi:DNA polymerase III alpha subunit
MTQQNKITVSPPKLFVGVHSHSALSVFDGLGLPPDHIDFVLENGMDAWCLTDHGHMNGYAFAHLHAEKLKKAGRNFKFIGGVEAYYHPDLEDWRDDYVAAKVARAEAKLKAKASDATEGSSEEEGSTVENESETKDVSKWFNPVNRRHHLVLLPKSRKGLENIFALVSKGYTQGFYKFPRIDRKMLKEHGEDVIVTTACVHPDALLVTSLGKLTIREVVEIVNAKREIEVLSFDEKIQRPVFMPVTWGGCTRKNAKLLKITLKNGATVKVTPDHKILTQRGWIEAQFLKHDDSVMSFSTDANICVGGSHLCHLPRKSKMLANNCCTVSCLGD